MQSLLFLAPALHKHTVLVPKLYFVFVSMIVLPAISFNHPLFAFFKKALNLIFKVQILMNGKISKEKASNRGKSHTQCKTWNNEREAKSLFCHISV